MEALGLTYHTVQTTILTDIYMQLQLIKTNYSVVFLFLLHYANGQGLAKQ